jgi:hypothetical protein
MFDRPSIASGYYRYFQVRDEIEQGGGSYKFLRGYDINITSLTRAVQAEHHFKLFFTH